MTLSLIEITDIFVSYYSGKYLEILFMPLIDLKLWHLSDLPLYRAI